MQKSYFVNQHALVKNSENKVLILESEGKYMLPGGRLEDKDSSPLEGLLRELNEELGIEEVKIERISDLGISESGDTLLIYYEVLIDTTPQIQLSSEHSSYAWVDTENIDQYIFWHKSNKQRILNYINGNSHGLSGLP